EEAPAGAPHAAPASSVSSNGPQRATPPRAAAPSAGQVWLEGSARLREEMLGFARTQIEEGLATGRAIWTCGSFGTALELQSRYVAKSMENGLQHTWALVQLSSDLVRATLAARDPG
ncbi:MAG: phasin family protein, partial [Geminicoccales bacterium]